jgi:hypothetical protein
MIYLLTVSIILLFVLAIMAVWRTGFRHWSFWIVIPFFVFNLGFVWHTISTLKGYPYQGMPPSEHQLLFFVVSKPDIYLLARGNNKPPRLYVVDYSEELSKKLSQAGQQMNDGQTVLVNRKKNLLSQDSLEFYNFDLQTRYPKD